MRPASPSIPAAFLRVRSGLRALALLPVLGLAGCPLPTHMTVKKTVVVPNVQEATIDQLVAGINQRFAVVQTITAQVVIAATTGGGHEGQVTDIPSSSGYIVLRKPLDLHVLMQTPVLRSRAVEMVTDGKQFKLLITIPLHPARAIEGSETITTPSKNGLENLRPSIIRDALLVAPVGTDEYIDRTEGSRVLEPAAGKKEAIEVPDYDLTFFRVRGDHLLQRLRVVHISRVTLLPYEQDIYNEKGEVVTIVTYDRYQKFGAIDFPMTIDIRRPIDEYTLKIDFNKLTLNDPVDDEGFVLKFPENLAVQKM